MDHKKEDEKESLYTKKLNISVNLVGDISKFSYLSDRNSGVVFKDEEMTDEKVKLAVDEFVSREDIFAVYYPCLDEKILKYIRKYRPASREELLHIIGYGFCILNHLGLENFENQEIEHDIYSKIGYREELCKYFLSMGIEKATAERVAHDIGRGAFAQVKCQNEEMWKEIMRNHGISDSFLYAIHYIEYIPNLRDIERPAEQLIRSMFQRQVNAVLHSPLNVKSICARNGEL